MPVYELFFFIIITIVGLFLFAGILCKHFKNVQSDEPYSEPLEKVLMKEIRRERTIRKELQTELNFLYSRIQELEKVSVKPKRKEPIWVMTQRPAKLNNCQE